MSFAPSEDRCGFFDFQAQFLFNRRRRRKCDAVCVCRALSESSAGMRVMHTEYMSEIYLFSSSFDSLDSSAHLYAWNHRVSVV